MASPNYLRVLAVLTVAIAAACVALLAAKPAHAATFRVNSMEDAGDDAWGDGVCASEPFQEGTRPKCTLRAAIEEANAFSGADTITFSSGMSGTITLTLGQLTIANDTPATDDLIIQGPGASALTVSSPSIDGSRLFGINQFADVTISGLTIANGTNGINSGSGGGISNSGRLTLTDSTVSSNFAEFEGGGIYNVGTLMLTDSTVSDNYVATSSSGSRSPHGGGIYNVGTMTLTNTTVSGNSANLGCQPSAQPPIFCPGVGGGGIYSSGTLTLTNSTVSDNSTYSEFTFDGFGGGILNDDGTLTLTNTTVSGNSTAHSGGGISNGGGTLTPTNTIIAGNTATFSNPPDAQGTFNSQGNNLIGNTAGSSGWTSSDLQNVDPLLGPFQDNGGPTFTHALLAGSPAVDAGNNTACPPTDQRGRARTDGDANGSVICDIGAFEYYDLTPPTVSSVTPPHGKTGVSRLTNVTATFSEPMDPATLVTDPIKQTSTTWTLVNTKTGATVDAKVNCDADPCQTVTLDPATKLARRTVYRATISTAAEDSAGNSLDQDPNTAGNQDMVWTFKTKRR